MSSPGEVRTHEARLRAYGRVLRDSAFVLKRMHGADPTGDYAQTAEDRTHDADAIDAGADALAAQATREAAHARLLVSVRSGLEAIQPFNSENVEHTNACNGGDDGPCDCPSLRPRDVVDALLEQVAAALAKSTPTGEAAERATEGAPPALVALVREWQKTTAVVRQLNEDGGGEDPLAFSIACELYDRASDALLAWTGADPPERPAPGEGK